MASAAVVGVARAAAGLFAALLTAGTAAAQSAAPAIALVAPGDCWGSADSGLDAALARCARMGVDIAEIVVRAGAGSDVQACLPSQRCAPLEGLLAAAPAPRLLLETPVSLLDDVQRSVTQAGAASRVLLQPRFDRPAGASSRSLAPGVRYRRVARSEPRSMMLHIVEVDLNLARMEFVVTTGQPEAGLEFRAEKTSDFARRQHTLVAVNASYFRPFDGGQLMARAYVPAIGQAVEVDGVSIAHGHVDSSRDNPDPRSDGAFCITPRTVAIVRDACPPDTTDAVGAGPVLLEGGRRLALAGEAGATLRSTSAGVASIGADELPSYYRQPQPRTAVGLDAAGRRLWFVVVDGRQEGYSAGISLPELAALFVELGAHTAINLDGGGSSTLAIATRDGVQVANSPIHTGIPGRERPVGNHLGLRIVDVKGDRR